jgi:hypothetical protein
MVNQKNPTNQRFLYQDFYWEIEGEYSGEKIIEG